MRSCRTISLTAPTAVLLELRAGGRVAGSGQRRRAAGESVHPVSQCGGAGERAAQCRAVPRSPCVTRCWCPRATAHTTGLVAPRPRPLGRPGRLVGRIRWRGWPAPAATATTIAWRSLERDRSAPSCCCWTPRAGYPVALTRIEPHYLWGQVRAEYVYSTWIETNGVFPYPGAVFRLADGTVNISRSVSSAALISRDSAPGLTVPAGAPAMVPIVPAFLTPTPPDTIHVGPSTYLLEPRLCGGGDAGARYRVRVRRNPGRREGPGRLGLDRAALPWQASDRRGGDRPCVASRGRGALLGCERCNDSVAPGIKAIPGTGGESPLDPARPTVWSIRAGTQSSSFGR